MFVCVCVCVRSVLAEAAMRNGNRVISHCLPANAHSSAAPVLYVSLLKMRLCLIVYVWCMSNCECAGERLNLNQAAFWEAVYASSQVLQVKVFCDETFFFIPPRLFSFHPECRDLMIWSWTIRFRSLSSCLFSSLESFSQMISIPAISVSSIVAQKAD